MEVFEVNHHSDVCKLTTRGSYVHFTSLVIPNTLVLLTFCSDCGSVYRRRPFGWAMAWTETAAGTTEKGLASFCCQFLTSLWFLLLICNCKRSWIKLFLFVNYLESCYLCQNQSRYCRVQAKSSSPATHMLFITGSDITLQQNQMWEIFIG